MVRIIIIFTFLLGSLVRGLAGEKEVVSLEQALTQTLEQYEQLEHRLELLRWKMTLIRTQSGSSGPQGPQGPIGPPGIKGPPGSNGSTGMQGIRGIDGPLGADGPPGDSGDSGPPGNSGERGPRGGDGPDGYPARCEIEKFDDWPAPPCREGNRSGEVGHLFQLCCR